METKEQNRSGKNNTDIIFLNGQFVNSHEAKVSVFDHGFLYGDGCFETLRTYNGKLFRLDEHVKRLLNSAQKMQITVPWKAEEIKEWMQETLIQNSFAESRLRITLTRGENGFNFVGAETPTILIVVTELKPHERNVFENGVKIETLEIERILPQVKSLNLLPSILGQQLKHQENVFETVFINHQGFLTEGTVSNFFIVKDSVILTAPKEDVLSGITRDLVFEIANKEGIKIEEKLFTLNDLLQSDEAFLSSTIMDIAPVVQVGKIYISNGKVGSITKTLIEEFAKQTFLK